MWWSGSPCPQCAEILASPWIFARGPGATTLADHRSGEAVTVTDGEVTFLSDSEIVGRTAAKDVATFAASDGATGEPAFGAAGISAAAGVASAIAGAGLFGIGLANSLKSSDHGEMEIAITNCSSQAVVVYDYDPSNCDVTNVPEPLAPGENDVFVITRQDAFDDTTKIELEMMIGGAANTTCVESSITFDYLTNYNPGRWAFQATVDGETSKFDSDLQIFGATFAGSSGYPSFSLYTATTETANGSLSVSVYDKAA